MSKHGYLLFFFSNLMIEMVLGYLDDRGSITCIRYMDEQRCQVKCMKTNKRKLTMIEEHNNI